MIEKCKVTKWNELVMVIDFKGIEVQMPSVDKADFVYVKLENGKYSTITENEYKKSLVKCEKKEIKINEEDKSK